MACGQRGWKAQPAGTATGLGGSLAAAAAGGAASASMRGIALEQGLGIGVLGVAEDLLGRAELDDPAEIHHRDPMTDVTDHAQIVADEHHGEMHLALQAHEQIEDLGLNRDVEGGDRFVRDQKLRPHGERARDGDPLTLAAAQRRRTPRAEIGRQSDRLQELRHARLDRRGRADAMDAQHLGQRLCDGEARIERGVRVLKDHLRPLAKGEQPGLVEREHVAVVEQHPARSGFGQAENRAAEGTLAAAALADQAQRLAALEPETDAIHRLDHPARAPGDDLPDPERQRIVDRQVLDLEQRRHGEERSSCQRRQALRRPAPASASGGRTSRQRGTT